MYTYTTSYKSIYKFYVFKQLSKANYTAYLKEEVCRNLEGKWELLGKGGTK